MTAQDIARTRLTGLAAVILLLAFPAAPASQPEEREEAESTRAKALWEMAIAAKGGRERLHAVRNIVTSGIHTYRKWLMPRRVTTESLFVLPHKSWSYDDQRPEVFGITVEWTDLERMLWCSEPSDSHSIRRINPRDRERRERDSRQMQVLQLMETAWVQPRPVRAYTARLRGRQVDVVEAVDGPDHYSFYLDPHRCLTLKLECRHSTQTEATYLYNYAPVDGIQMPHLSGSLVPGRYGEAEYKTELKYQFNVKYDPAIFERVPRIEDGPQGWKPKVK